MLPFTIPLVVSGLGMMTFFGEIRVLGSLWPVGLALCVINLPFMIWAVGASVNALDDELENAAANCGAPPVQVFFTVTLPAVMPGVITGGLLMFILAFNEFLVSLFLVDSRTVTLPVQIYNSIRSVINPPTWRPCRWSTSSSRSPPSGCSTGWSGLEIFLRSK